nr:MAG TPA: hypothetical protein [Caudoviricetes sp.]
MPLAILSSSLLAIDCYIHTISFNYHFVKLLYFFVAFIVIFYIKKAPAARCLLVMIGILYMQVCTPDRNGWIRTIAIDFISQYLKSRRPLRLWLLLYSITIFPI